MFSEHDEILLGAFQQIEESILLLQQWNLDIRSEDDYLFSPEGMKNLAATCMLIEAIGETIKKIDKKSNGTLLILRPEIPWKQVMGMRDRISHGYFEIDVEYIDDIIKNDLDPLLTAIEDLIKIVTIV